MPVDRQQDDGTRFLVLALLGALTAGHLLVVGTGAVVSALHGRPFLLPVDQAWPVLQQLPANLSNPRLAWPRPLQPALAGPLLMYLALGACLLVPLGLAVVLLPRLRPKPTNRVGPPSQAFAERADLEDLVVKGPESGRVILGHAHGRLIATEPEHSVLVVGATRSGKTTGYAIPALREWDGPAIVLSAKSDLLHATWRDREQRGRVQVYDPTGVSGLPSDGWSPLSSSGGWRGAVRAANAMSRVSGTTAGLGGANKHWERVAAQLLAPLLLAASTGGLDMGDVVRWVMTKELRQPQALLELVEDEGELALLSLRSYLGMEPRARDSAFGTARTVLDAYEDPDIVAASARWQVRPEQLLDGGSHTLYLVANSNDQVRLAPVFLALLEEMLRAAFVQAAERRASSGSSLRAADGSAAPRLLLLLDEAANIAPLPDLATLASTAGGEGIQLVTIYQDLSQVRHRYGDEWGSIVSNHVAKVVLPGITDPETLRYFTSAVGEEEVVATSTSTGDGRRSTTESLTSRAIVPARALRELPRGQGLCLYGHRAPVRFQLRTPGPAPPNRRRPGADSAHGRADQRRTGRAQ